MRAEIGGEGQAGARDPDPARGQTRPMAGLVALSVDLTVNGSPVHLDVEPRVSLLDALREHLGLTGPKKGCNQGACGACTVLVDGQRVVSCLTLAVQHEGREVVTVEGLGLGQPDGRHPLQDAFVRHDGFQCGFCTSGQLCSAIGMLAEHAAGLPSHVTEHVSDQPGPLSRKEIQERMSGNLCRCGAYNGIVDAIEDVAARGSAGQS